MTMHSNRRDFLAIAASLVAASAGGPLRSLAAETGRRYGPAQDFNFEGLTERARLMAQSPYAERPAPQPELIREIDFDAVQGITFKPDHTLWPSGSGGFPLRLFHLHRYNPTPVRLNVVGKEGARELLYDPGDFSYKSRTLREALSESLGYAGFRVMDGAGEETDWLAFAGASYFRSSGEDAQYGASARGIAVDSGLPTPEEFPSFVEFWLSEPESGDRSVTIHALLDGPSVTGAFQFLARKPGAVVMDVKSAFFFRRPVERLGIAPLTSMYWYGENDRLKATDWRPEIHDSDGLALATGGGEQIWRPLVNPDRTQANSFYDEDPRGFGLMQRDRRFEDYEDDGAFYERRPGIWVEPIGKWGKGAVTLIELPTDDEIHDNIVAFWTPEKPVEAGEQLTFSYRLHWCNDLPYPPEKLALAISTRIGEGGVPGQSAPGDAKKRKFVIDFRGGPLSAMEARFDLEAVIDASRGQPDNAYVVKVVGTDRWRAVFDLPIEGREPIDLRCYLRLGGETLTETWLYQYLPARDRPS